MAQPIQHEPKPQETALGAQQAWQQLLETLHRQGVLRLLNDWIAAGPQVSGLLVEGLKTEGADNAVQNLGVIAQVLGRVPPAQLYQVLTAAAAGLERTTELAPDMDPDAPGVTGAYKLLKDEALWDALIPLLEGLKAFSQRLDRRVDAPAQDLDTQTHARSERGRGDGHAE